jgi:hypothetical protein
MIDQDAFEVPQVEEKPYYEVLEGQYLIQALFNFIMRTIKDFEILDRKNLDTKIIAKEVWGVQQLTIQLLHESPSLKSDSKGNPNRAQRSGLNRLVRAKNDSRDAKFNAEEVSEFVKVFTRFPRNITCDKRSKTNEPYLRLMTSGEKKRVLRPADACLNTPFYNEYIFKEKLNNVAAQTREEAERQLNNFVLSFTPNQGDRTSEIGSVTVYCLSGDQNPDCTSRAPGAPMQETAVRLIL